MMDTDFYGLRIPNYATIQEPSVPQNSWMVNMAGGPPGFSHYPLGSMPSISNPRFTMQPSQAEPWSQSVPNQMPWMANNLQPFPSFNGPTNGSVPHVTFPSDPVQQNLPIIPTPNITIMKNNEPVVHFISTPYLVESPPEEDKTRSFYFNRGSHTGIKRAKNSDDDEDEDSCSSHDSPSRGYEDIDEHYDSYLSSKGPPVKFCVGEDRVTAKFSHMGLGNSNQNPNVHNCSRRRNSGPSATICSSFSLQSDRNQELNIHEVFDDDPMVDDEELTEDHEPAIKLSDEVNFCLDQDASSSGLNSWLKREMEKPTKALILWKPVSNPLLSVYGPDGVTVTEADDDDECHDGKSSDTSDGPFIEEIFDDDPIEVSFTEAERVDTYCNNNNQMIDDDSMAD